MFRKRKGARPRKALAAFARKEKGIKAGGILRCRGKLVAAAVGRPALAKRLFKQTKDPVNKLAYALAAQFGVLPKQTREKIARKIGGSNAVELWDNMLLELSRSKGETFAQLYESLKENLCQVMSKIDTTVTLVQIYPSTLRALARAPSAKAALEIKLPLSQGPCIITVQKISGGWRVVRRGEA